MVAGSLLHAFLEEHPLLTLDTSVFIYFVELHPTYHGLCSPVFASIEKGSSRATTSTLTLLEILVQPYRKKLDELVLKLYALLTTYPNIEWIELNLDIADTAARLRADHRMKTPDAIQAATAICSGATGFLCNDAVFRRVNAFDTLLLDDCL